MYPYIIYAFKNKSIHTEERPEASVSTFNNG